MLYKEKQCLSEKHVYHALFVLRSLFLKAIILNLLTVNLYML